MENVLLDIRNLSAWYVKGRPVIEQFDLSIADHEVIGLIGLNGAGKTTLLNTICGLHDGFSFTSLAWRGEPVLLRDDNFKKNRYMAFAEGAPFGYFTFDEYLQYALKAYGKQLDHSAIDAMIAGFHFESYRNKLIKDLSTGNKKKVFLIAGFALAPPLLLLDEPVNGLDFQSTEYLYGLIRGYREHGTILFSSHILESISQTSDQVIVLEEGRIMETFKQGQIDPERIREVLHYEEKL